MLNLKLFTQLQGDTTASLLLRPSKPGVLQFFVISSSVNYSIVVAGECDGELPTTNPRSFDVVLSTLAPLLDKNHKFKLSYAGGILHFVETGDRFSFEPLCVEHVSDFAVDVVKKYMEFSGALDTYTEAKEKRGELEQELMQLKANYKSAKILSLSGGAPSNPFGSIDDVVPSSIGAHYEPRIAELEEKLESIQEQSIVLKECNMDSFKRIATIAARNNTTVAMCESYALVDLGTAYVIQKVDCGVRSIQGKLLQRLLQEQGGQFYEYDGELIFRAVAGKGSERSDTFVFLNSYLPSTLVDSSIITKGAVKEKYKLNLKGMLQVASTVLAKFQTMEFGMGNSSMVLANDRGERLVYKFEVEDAKTIELNKMLRGESVGDVVMSNVEIPRVVQKVLPMMKDEFTIYVKERKVVLQSDTLYVVFSK